MKALLVLYDLITTGFFFWYVYTYTIPFLMTSSSVLVALAFMPFLLFMGLMAIITVLGSITFLLMKTEDDE